ncbi:MAG: hypothetical protein KAH01_08455 [Caldisericia bacterium]|nr:hypothetical protein [Caldisericia bacterium]
METAKCETSYMPECCNCYTYNNKHWLSSFTDTNYIYTDNSTQPPSTKEYEVSYCDDGRPSSYIYKENDIEQYRWNYYYSPAGLDKMEKIINGFRKILIDATVALNGKVLSIHYEDFDCQTGSCYTGEASMLYDPCDNLTSIIDNATSTEVWAKATDKNSGAAIAIYNPHDMEIPLSAKATINPAYDQSIGGPIEFRIPEQGQWDLEEMLANQTKINTSIGTSGVDASMDGGDDCDEDECDECDPENMFPDAKDHSANDEWYDNVHKSYHGDAPGESELDEECTGWKDMDCEDLKTFKKDHLMGGTNGWNTMQKYGFTGDYGDYKPGSDYYYAISIFKYFKSDTAEGWRKNYISNEQAYEDQVWRFTIAGLQVVDCLLEKKDCD